jgi:hypothetical protein
MMSKWFKIILILLALGTLTAALVFKFVYNKPHPDFEEEQAIFSLEVEEIYDSYKKNHVLADEMYLGQVVELKGEISTIEESDGLLIVSFVFEEGMFGDEGVRCTFLDNQKQDASLLKVGEQIILKGYCTGYNDTDVILEKCSFVKN